MMQILKFKTIEEVTGRANNSNYQLAAAVFSKDWARPIICPKPSRLALCGSTAVMCLGPNHHSVARCPAQPEAGRVWAAGTYLSENHQGRSASEELLKNCASSLTHPATEGKDISRKTKKNDPCTLILPQNLLIKSQNLN